MTVDCLIRMEFTKLFSAFKLALLLNYFDLLMGAPLRNKNTLMTPADREFCLSPRDWNVYGDGQQSGKFRKPGKSKDDVKNWISDRIYILSDLF